MSGFVLPGNDFWRNLQATTPCSDLDASHLDSRVPRAVQILQSAGYTWRKIPSASAPGSGLASPDGTPFPVLSVLGPSDFRPSLADERELQQAGQIIDAVKQLGIVINYVVANSWDTRYAVLSSQKYDMAILGWDLSLYPGYLCQWFGGQGKFFYGSEGLKSECKALAGESDLASAQKDVFEIQTILAQDLPFIPLYADVRYDAYHNIRYPFESVLGGLGGLYGAPSYAIPAP